MRFRRTAILFGIVAVISAALALALFLLRSPRASGPAGTISHQVAPGLDAALNILFHARLRRGMEQAVVAFQVAGVLSLTLARLLPRGRWADRSRSGFVVAVVGLGTTGTTCAWYGSGFALFAGETLTVLMIGLLIGDPRPSAPLLTHPEITSALPPALPLPIPDSRPHLTGNGPLAPSRLPHLRGRTPQLPPPRGSCQVA